MKSVRKIISLNLRNSVWAKFVMEVSLDVRFQRNLYDLGTIYYLSILNQLEEFRDE